MVNEVPLLLRTKEKQLRGAVVSAQAWICDIEINLLGRACFGPVGEVEVNHVPFLSRVRDRGIDVPFAIGSDDRGIFDGYEMMVRVRGRRNQRARGFPLKRLMEGRFHGR